jgi:uncharacterized protein YndB with AHSA1/START domain
MTLSFRQLLGCHPTIATIWLSKEAGMETRRKIEIEASPEEVWEALATEEGREAWLEDEPPREILVEHADEPHRLVWWWWTEDAPATRVEVLVVAAPIGARVVVVESEPSFPLPALAARFSPALALA